MSISRYPRLLTVELYSLFILVAMPPSLRSALKKTARVTQGDEVLATQAGKRPANRKWATQPQSKLSDADDVVNAAISQVRQASGLRSIRVRLNLSK
jgi:hypothetical protein